MYGNETGKYGVGTKKEKRIMYDKFLKLVNQVEEIRAYAHETHVPGFFESDFVLYDVPEFMAWKQSLLYELQKMKESDFITNVISIINHFEGYDDRKDFDELVGALNAMKDDIQEEKMINNDEQKKRKIFISHATNDKKFIKPFVELLEDLGLNEDEIICSSVPPYCVPLGGKVYEWLVNKFQTGELHMFFMLSHNYYDSPASLNEMGAAWAMKQKWTGILLPKFDFSDIRGCIDPTQISIKLDDDDRETLLFRLEELKDTLTDEFQLRKISNTVWVRKRDDFLHKVDVAIKSQDDEIKRQEIVVLDRNIDNESKRSINVDSCVLLVYGANGPGGQIVVSSDLCSKSISANNIEFIKDGDKRNTARWIAALSELVNHGYVKEINSNIYEVTYSGYNFADQVKNEFKIDTSQDYEQYLVD